MYGCRAISSGSVLLERLIWFQIQLSVIIIFIFFYYSLFSGEVVLAMN